MAGALTERDFVTKMYRAGFCDVHVHERRSVGIDELSHYPLFTEELLELMRRLIPAPAQSEIGVAIVVTGRRGGDGRGQAGPHPASVQYDGAPRRRTW